MLHMEYQINFIPLSFLSFSLPHYLSIFLSQTHLHLHMYTYIFRWAWKLSLGGGGVFCGALTTWHDNNSQQVNTQCCLFLLIIIIQCRLYLCDLMLRNVVCGCVGVCACMCVKGGERGSCILMNCIIGADKDCTIFGADDTTCVWVLKISDIYQNTELKSPTNMFQAIYFSFNTIKTNDCIFNTERRRTWSD